MSFINNYNYTTLSATDDAAMDVDSTLTTASGSEQVLARLAALSLAPQDASIPPPTPRIPQGSFPSFSSPSDLPSFPSAASLADTDILTPCTPPRYRCRPSSFHPEDHYFSLSHGDDDFSLPPFPATNLGLGLGFTNLPKPDGSGLPLTGLGILPHHPDSPYPGTHAPSHALLAEVYATFSSSDRERGFALDLGSPSPFLLRRSQLPPLGPVSPGRLTPLDAPSRSTPFGPVSPGRVSPAVFEDVFYLGGQDGKGRELVMDGIVFSN
ncbi:hypothetical protein OE88DRAFT_1655410 [Heliocybe sulcata]|uniref:Uncharacterized protein n=1 Tax=Heliocybe sulcata TaxID=5364 RepID=A0A5C3N649_9AGAM|nr:hypothetical protein OE88DRAFT_1655410 [Heliocybe sulcata]